MDPNETLKQIRSLIESLADTDVGGFYPDVADLIDLIDALDGWLLKGGFLPIEWTPSNVAERTELLEYRMRALRDEFNQHIRTH